MPDIALCTGEGCPLKDKCHRYLAKPCQWRQSYFATPPYKDGECEHFWEEKPKSDTLKK